LIFSDLQILGSKLPSTNLSESALQLWCHFSSK